MFLSKKNQIVNKPKNAPKGKRALGGWDDDSDHEQSKNAQAQQTTFNSQPFREQQVEDILGGFQQINIHPQQKPMPLQQKKPQKNQKQERVYLDWDKLAEKEGIQCQRKIVQQIVHPGGIRIKPSESILSSFLKECRGMDVSVVGSLLLSKIQVNYPFQVKAKALHTIEHLAKKDEIYASYFQSYYQKLAEFPQPQDNVQNFRKILKNVLSTIGTSTTTTKSNFQPEGDILEFVDPGYNQQKKNDPISFIRSNEKKKSQAKRPVVGPENAKMKNKIGPATLKKEVSQGSNKQANDNNDILELDLLENPQDPPEKQDKKCDIDLLDHDSSEPSQQKSQSTVTFDQLLTQTGKPQDFGFL